MTKKLCAIVSLAIALTGCMADAGADDVVGENADEQTLDVESTTQALASRGASTYAMPSVGTPWELVNLASSRREKDLLMEHRSSGNTVTATFTNLSRSREVVNVRVAVSATCRSANGTQQATYTGTWSSPDVTWVSGSNSFSATQRCPTGWTLQSKRSVFTVTSVYISP